MKLFTASQVKAHDEFTIREQAISSVRLMERAAEACVQWITGHYGMDHAFLVVCGMGNNGGDGLAITRLLLQDGFTAKAVVLKHRDLFSDDTSHNFTALHQIDPDAVQVLDEGAFLAGIAENVILIDAIFGNGLNRPPEGWIATFIQELNELPNTKIAIDLPSGLPADTIPPAGSAIINATATLTFHAIKRSMLHPETSRFAGAVHVLDIGLSTRFEAATHTQYHTIDAAVIKDIYRPRNAFGHKGTFGSVQLAGGSYGKIGAITLAAQAALRTGAGLVFALAPECGYNVLQTAVPEAMFIRGGSKHLDTLSAAENIKALGIGPGMGTAGETAEALLQFVEESETPMVIDADALNILSTRPDVLYKLSPDTILTPHPREFERLFGAVPDSMQQVEMGRAKAMKHNIYIVLKGHHTTVLTPSGECWYNTTGNAGMATGGSGDVLTGILASLRAQGYTAEATCLLGVYLHGLAGDKAAQLLSQEAMAAGDIITHLGGAFREIASLR